MSNLQKPLTMTLENDRRDTLGRQQNNANPRVLILMPVYNAKAYLDLAMSSILGQTWRDFELICIDDGSTDQSLQMLRDFECRDPRIRVISRPNTGIVGALNDGLAVAKGEFIARMDADDIAFLSRLERQVEFLQIHREIACVGCGAIVIDNDGDPVNVFRVPLTHDEIDDRHIRLGLGGGILHSTTLIRTQALAQLAGYRRGTELAEDLDLWLRMAEIGKLANLESPLLYYRLNTEGLSSRNITIQNQRANAVVSAARLRRNLNHLPPPNNFCKRTGEAFVRDLVSNARREGFWKAAQKYAVRLIRMKPITKFGWRVLIESTSHRIFGPKREIYLET